MLVDVGVGAGALVVYAPAALAGAEVELSPAPGAARTHQVVHERRTARGTVFAALFGSLPAGAYTVWPPHAAAARAVTIHSGEVTELRLPS